MTTSGRQRRPMRRVGDVLPAVASGAGHRSRTESGAPDGGMAAHRGRARACSKRFIGPPGRPAACARRVGVLARELAIVVHVARSTSSRGEQRVQLLEPQRRAARACADDAGLHSARSADRAARASRRARRARPRLRGLSACVGACRSLFVSARESSRARRCGSSPRASRRCARSTSCRRERSAASRIARIAGTTSRLPSQCMKSVTWFSMITSACATAFCADVEAFARDLAEIVHGIEKDVVERADFRFDVARHREIEHEHRAVLARLQRAFDESLADERQRRGGRAHDDVVQRELRRQVVQRDDAAEKALGELLRARFGAVRERHVPADAARRNARRRARSSRPRRRRARSARRSSG